MGRRQVRLQLGNEELFVVDGDLEGFKEHWAATRRRGELLRVDDVDREGNLRETLYINPNSIVKVQDHTIYDDA